MIVNANTPNGIQYCHRNSSMYIFLYFPLLSFFLSWYYRTYGLYWLSEMVDGKNNATESSLMFCSFYQQRLNCAACDCHNCMLMASLVNPKNDMKTYSSCWVQILCALPVPLGQGKSLIYRESQECHLSVILCENFPSLCWNPTT